MMLIKKISTLFVTLLLLLVLSGVAGANLIGFVIVNQPSEPMTMFLFGIWMVIFAGYGKRSLDELAKSRSQKGPAMKPPFYIENTCLPDDFHSRSIGINKRPTSI